MLARLLELPALLLDLVEQARVLDGDHRLVGEGFEQTDLPAVNERTVQRFIDITPTSVPWRINGTPSRVRISPSF